MNLFARFLVLLASLGMLLIALALIPLAMISIIVGALSIDAYNYLTLLTRRVSDYLYDVATYMPR